MTETSWKKALLIGITITLAGCGATMPKKPTKPTLTAAESEGMVCFSQDDAAALGGYILELERGYSN